MFVCSFCSVLVAQSCPNLCNPMDCSLPVSSILGILQARILGWVVISFSRGSSPPRDQTQVSCAPPGKPGGQANYVACFSISLVLSLIRHKHPRMRKHTHTHRHINNVRFILYCYIVYVLTSVSDPGRDISRWFSLQASLPGSVMEMWMSSKTLSLTALEETWMFFSLDLMVLGGLHVCWAVSLFTYLKSGSLHLSIHPSIHPSHAPHVRLFATPWT